VQEPSRNIPYFISLKNLHKSPSKCIFYSENHPFYYCSFKFLCFDIETFLYLMIMTFIDTLM
jgi:hypothetical protein